MTPNGQQCAGVELLELENRCQEDRGGRTAPAVFTPHDASETNARSVRGCSGVNSTTLFRYVARKSQVVPCGIMGDHLPLIKLRTSIPWSASVSTSLIRMDCLASGIRTIAPAALLTCLTPQPLLGVHQAKIEPAPPMPSERRRARVPWSNHPWWNDLQLH